jgi:hypothetical protein
VSVRALTLSLLLAVPAALAAQPSKATAPESFRANGQITGVAGGAASEMVFKIDKYTADADHDALVKALKDGGNAAFLAALKKAPKVGTLTIGQRSLDIRWARTRTEGTDNRRVAFVTDQPAFFAGAGAADAKPTAGYDLAAVEFTIDSVGLGSGTMAPAAKVKAGGPTGVEVDDYSGKRITLTTVTRNLSK